MISLIISSMLCLLSSYYGYFIYKHKKDILSFYKRWDEFNDLMIREIGFNKTPIENILKMFDVKKGAFDKILVEYERIIKTNLDINKLNIKNLSLDKKVDVQIIEYFLNIGNVDYQSQINYLKNYKEILKDKIDKSTKDCNKNGMLALKLGIIFGIAIMVLMI